jgi:hypothetical protein
MGKSPCKMILDFKTEFTYLTNQNKEDELLVRKVNRKGKQFEDLGLDPETVTENDINLNLRKSPSSSSTKDEDAEYLGPDAFPFLDDRLEDREDIDTKYNIVSIIGVNIC